MYKTKNLRGDHANQDLNGIINQVYEITKSRNRFKPCSKEIIDLIDLHCGSDWAILRAALEGHVNKPSVLIRRYLTNISPPIAAGQLMFL